jgi:hypothetical protein
VWVPKKPFRSAPRGAALTDGITSSRPLFLSAKLELYCFLVFYSRFNIAGSAFDKAAYFMKFDKQRNAEK